MYRQQIGSGVVYIAIKLLICGCDIICRTDVKGNVDLGSRNQHDVELKETKVPESAPNVPTCHFVLS